MSEENNSPDIKKEADVLIELGTLLRKSRSQEKQKQVHRIFNSNISSEEKVRRITQIDEETDQSRNQDKRGQAKSGGSALHELKREAKNKKNRQPPNHRYYGTVQIRDHTSPQKKHIRKNIHLKRQYQRLGYFPFLFNHYKKMKEFGFTTKTMFPTVFPPNVKLERGLDSYLEMRIKPVAKEINMILDQLIGNSWLFLRKKEYNLLVLLIELCTLIEQTSFPDIDFYDRDAIDKLKKIEQRLLLIYYSESNPDVITGAVQTLMDKNRREIKNIEILATLIDKLLAHRSMKPSLCTIILALNMKKYRRFFSMDDLLLKGEGEVIETRQFDCSEETQEKINLHIEKLLYQLHILQEEQKEILKIRSFLQKDKNGNIDITPLRELYENGHPTGEVSFENERDNLPVFIQHFLQTFLAVFQKVLHSDIAVSKLGYIHLFKGEPFQKEIGKLQILVGKCEDIRFKLPSFNKSRYMEIVLQNVQAIEIEAEMVSIIDETLSCLKTIASGLLPLIQKASASRELAPEEFEPVTLQASAQGAVMLPLANTYLEKDHFHGRTIGNILRSLISVVYSLGFYLNDRTILKMLSRESQVQHEIEAISKTLERIAPPETFQEIQENLM